MIASVQNGFRLHAHTPEVYCAISQ